MSLIYLAFANNKNNPLPSLREEEDKIYSYLIRRAQQKHFDVQKDSFATTRKIAEYLNLFKDEITVFHYSGHASGQELFLEDGAAAASGIAALLELCPKLKLIVLNGCATQGQLERLKKLRNHPVVIYTNAPVGDHSATLFSVSFYQSLCELYEPVETAFEAGIAAAKTIEKDISPTKGLALRQSDVPVEMWGLYLKDAFDLEWKLPLKHQIGGTPSIFVNELLLEALIQPLTTYHASIRQLVEHEEHRGNINILDRREAILKSFPLPLSEQLRKLIVPGKEDAHEYYDEIGLPRLRQLVTTYDTFIELLTFSLLAQLWQEFSDQHLQDIDLVHKEKFRKLFQLGYEDRLAFDFPSIIKSVIEIFEANGIGYFFSEMEDKASEMTSGALFQNACNWFQLIKLRLHGISGPPLTEQDIPQICIESEKYLATVVSTLAFLTNYKIVCVKDIGVLKYRHRKKPAFRHRVVRLIQRFVGLQEQFELRDKVLESASVLFLRETSDGESVLNLTPFVIDHNAFDEKAPLTKIHYFDRYQKELDAYAFRHVYKPDDLPLVIRSESHFEIIKEQFNDFSRLIFNQSVNAL